jgi:dynein heavy chain
MGVGGSGKQSLARFAAYVADCDLHTVSMAAGYNLARFRQEVKHIIKVSTSTCSEWLEVAIDALCVPESFPGWISRM